MLSFNLWAGWHPLADLGLESSATAFDLIDQLTSNLLLPLGGLAIATFAGWAVPVRALADELRLAPRATLAMRVLLRYVAPAGIAAATLLPALLRS